VRTSVSDAYHADVVIRLLLLQNWTRVSVFYEADDFGVGLKMQFESRPVMDISILTLIFQDKNRNQIKRKVKGEGNQIGK